jgi:protein TonB
VLVSEQGKAAQVRLLTSSGFKSLDDSAAAAVRSWKFQPAERAGKPTACWVKVPVNFRIDDSGR